MGAQFWNSISTECPVKLSRVSHVRFVPRRSRNRYFWLLGLPALFTLFLLASPGRTSFARMQSRRVTNGARANQRQGPVPAHSVLTDLNPIDDTQTFVTQHYLDFLSRDPDVDGLLFWMNNVESCGADEACREAKRIDTSAAYFLSIEFQETGYFVHRFYKASFGRRPLFSEFLADTQMIRAGVVVNVPGWDETLAQNKEDFLADWITRSAFTSVYDALNNGEFVDTLIANTGAVFSPIDRDAFVDVLNTQALTRQQVLRLIAENDAFYNSEYNTAFVEMQYFGYLRRNPEDAPNTNLDGFNFWLNKLNEFGGDFRRADMVKAFLVSGEYRQRFVTP